MTRNTSNVSEIIINGKVMERVDQVKLLVVKISSDLSLNAHVNHLLSKVAKCF